MCTISLVPQIHLHEAYNYTHCMLKLNTLPPPCKMLSIAYAKDAMRDCVIIMILLYCWHKCCHLLPAYLGLHYNIDNYK